MKTPGRAQGAERMALPGGAPANAAAPGTGGNPRTVALLEAPLVPLLLRLGTPNR